MRKLFGEPPCCSLNLLPVLACRADGVPLTALDLYKPPRRKAVTAAKPAAAAPAVAEGGPATNLAGQSQQQKQQQQQQQRQSPLDVSAGGVDPQQGAAAVVDWGATIRSSWDISERGALHLLTTFLSSSTGLSAYESARSYADGRSVSKLSPYLHFGQLSARLMWQRMKVAK